MRVTREEFLRRRKSGVGGSDIAAIAGMSPWRSPLDVYLDKTGETESVESSPVGQTASLWWGSVTEENIARAFAEVTGYRVERFNGLLTGKQPWHIGDVDRLVCPYGTRTSSHGVITTDTGLEIKNVRFRSDEWGAEGTDEIPLHYLCQVQWYMGLCESLKQFYVAVLFSGCDLRIYNVKRGENVIAHLREVADRFWLDHVLKKCPPPPRSAEEVNYLFPAETGKKIVVSADAENRISRISKVNAEIRLLEEEKKGLVDLVTTEAKDAEILTDAAGKTLATWKQGQKNRVFLVKKQGA